MRIHGINAFLLFLAPALAALGSSCGYSLQTSRNPLADREGIRRVYVAPLINNTYKAGVENLVYNALIRTLASHRRVVLAKSAEDADAVLQGTVLAAEYVGISATQASGLTPNIQAPSLTGDPQQTVIINTVYQANLVCSFMLRRHDPPPGKRLDVWGGTLSRSKPFSAANQAGTLGTTSALINDSEFDRALSEVAQSMMADVHESMLAMF